MPSQRLTIAQRVNAYLAEPDGEQFTDGKRQSSSSGAHCSCRRWSIRSAFPGCMTSEPQ